MRRLSNPSRNAPRGFEFRLCCSSVATLWWRQCCDADKKHLLLIANDPLWSRCRWDAGLNLNLLLRTSSWFGLKCDCVDQRGETATSASSKLIIRTLKGCCYIYYCIKTQEWCCRGHWQGCWIKLPQCNAACQLSQVDLKTSLNSSLSAPSEPEDILFSFQTARTQICPSPGADSRFNSCIQRARLAFRWHLNHTEAAQPPADETFTVQAFDGKN